jgi:hypothetical protein
MDTADLWAISDTHANSFSSTADWENEETEEACIVCKLCTIDFTKSAGIFSDDVPHSKLLFTQPGRFFATLRVFVNHGMSRVDTILHSIGN